MPATLTTLELYLSRVTPAVILGAMLLFLARREPKLRIVSYLALFVLLRDAMTPLGLWSFGAQGFFWIRLHDDPGFLMIFAMACLGMTLAIYFFDRENRPLLQWLSGPWQNGLLWGTVGAAVVVAPFVVI